MSDAAPATSSTDDAYDWSTFAPRERATLCFVFRDSGREVLLIHKKRGLGAGKVNGPGGRIDPGESPVDCAVRETREEVGLRVDPRDATLAGELFFAFKDGHTIHGYVFRAARHTGDAIETDEAVPLWTAVDEIPYDKMWADDRHWIPLMLAGKPFVGRFTFDGDRMLSMDVRETPPL